MTLSIRPKVYSLPSYSLTGDLLGYLRCGLQYRYHRIGKLPGASRPIQQWFGEFIHGVLEEAFRRYRDSALKGTPSLPPWPGADLDDIKKLIKTRLGARGLYAWSPDLEQLGDDRATASRSGVWPPSLPSDPSRRGATDRRAPPARQSKASFSFALPTATRWSAWSTSSHTSSSPTRRSRRTRSSDALKAGLGAGLPPKFEVIIDYKGMRRPPVPTAGAKNGLWTQYEWQLQTYGELRRTQPDALTVVAGVLLYVNELAPYAQRLEHLKDEIANGTTDITLPAPGSPDDVALKTWKTSRQAAPAALV